MFKKIIAIAAAACCAGLIVTFASDFASEVMAGTSQPAESGAPDAGTISKPVKSAAPSAADVRNAVEQNLRKGSRNPKIICENSWPYYEQSCLHGARQSDGRVVRIIATDGSVAVRR